MGGYYYERNRSEFQVWIYRNDNNSYNISTSPKYTVLIDSFFPEFVKGSPTKWRDSKKYKNICSLWLPEGCYREKDIESFKKWCEKAVEKTVWLGLNKHIKDYFSNELDFCMACNFNFKVENDEVRKERTHVGEAEYQLKYYGQELSRGEKEAYWETLLKAMKKRIRFIPGIDQEEWCLSPMPALERNKEKLAWELSKVLSEELELDFVDATLRCEKPEMKQLSVKDKIQVWDELYGKGYIDLGCEIQNRRVLLVDDLYQSGATMWEYAKYLKSKGAGCVWGLACVKSMKDSDNYA